MTTSRRPAAILGADVVGYSRLMGADDEGTLHRLQAVRADIVDPAVAEYRGRIFNMTGDGLLTEFASVVDTIRCATAAQRLMFQRRELRYLARY
jgi:adenylate cyclase